jgi:hypothetical protein
MGDTGRQRARVEVASPESIVLAVVLARHQLHATCLLQNIYMHTQIELL